MKICVDQGKFRTSISNILGTSIKHPSGKTLQNLQVFHRIDQENETNKTHITALPQLGSHMEKTRSLWLEETKTHSIGWQVRGTKLQRTLACVAGVWKGREREFWEREFWAREKRLPRAPLAFLSRLKLPFPKRPFPSLSNACHAGYAAIPYPFLVVARTGYATKPMLNISSLWATCGVTTYNCKCMNFQIIRVTAGNGQPFLFSCQVST